MEVVEGEGEGEKGGGGRRWSRRWSGSSGGCRREQLKEEL